MENQKALFAAGCFWGVEATFSEVPGVISTSVCYSGGHVDNPSYEDVCSHKTGHAETVEVTFDPSKVSYEKLLTIFWELHDPTTMNRQGFDIGDQYRSAIFYHNEEQKNAAVAGKQALEASGKYKKPIVTEITPASQYWLAEDYHQQYFKKRGISH